VGVEGLNTITSLEECECDVSIEEEDLERVSGR
jgi:hypothetical protein